MANKKKIQNMSKQHLQIASGVAAVMLVVLVVVGVMLFRQGAKPTGQDSIQASQTTDLANSSAPTQSGSHADPQPSDDPQTVTDPRPSAGYVPTESDPLPLEPGLYVVHMGNFSGRFVEDGSDAQVDNFCAVIVENRSDKTLQLLQFQLTCGEQTYNFQLTTLPAGQRAIVQDLNRTTYAASEADVTSNVDVCLFFTDEPSLHEDIFEISGTESGIELRNRTNKEIPGPIYVYYKTRTADGYFGGITYRVSIPGLDANGTYSTAVKHFWPGSSQVMFIEYAQ